MLTSILRSLFRPKPKETPLEREIRLLEAKISREEASMDRAAADFWRDGGVCCPNCGLPGYSERASAQERRERWLRMLHGKLEKRLGTL